MKYFGLKYFHLIWAGLWRKRARTFFTMASIVVAFLLFGLLQGINQGFNTVLANLDVDRLYVSAKTNMTDGLPISYGEPHSQRCPACAPFRTGPISAATTRTRATPIPAFATDPEPLFKVYKEIKIKPEYIEAMKKTRTGVLVGERAGEEVRLEDRRPHADRHVDLDHEGRQQHLDVRRRRHVRLVGVRRGLPVLLHQPGLLQGEQLVRRQRRALLPGQHHRSAPGDAHLQARSTRCSRTRPTRSRTQTESALAQMQLKQLGDINFIANAIVGAVLFTLLFLTANTMMQSVSERTPELAVLKTLGFSDGKVLTLVLIEALALCVFAAAARPGDRGARVQLRRAQADLRRLQDAADRHGDGRRRGAAARDRQRLAAGVAREAAEHRRRAGGEIDGHEPVQADRRRHGDELRSLPQRVGTSLVIVIGIAGVVAVLVSVLAMSTGMLETMENSGRDDRAIVLRNGSASESGSALGRDAARLVEDAAGIKRDSARQADRRRRKSLRLVNLFRKEDGAEVNVAMRGVGPQLAALRPELKIVEGRMFQPAVTEVIVGKAAHAQFKGLNVGDQIKTRGATWTVVGVFATGGDSHESGADDRCGDADRGRAARRLPERDRAAGIAGRVPDVQGLAQLPIRRSPST